MLTIHGSQPIITLSDPDTGSTSTISGNSGHLILNADSGSDASNNTIDFQVDNDQKMRIDSSGNLLVGKTTIATGTAGIALRSNGEVRGTANGDYAARFSRLSSDGAIVGFEKDGAAVGSIGIQTGGLTIDGETNHTGLMFAGASVLPRDNSANTDGTIDLGTTDGRWKDLYLSGGVKWTEGQVEINSSRLLMRSTGDASGLRFDGSGYTPFKNGSVADGTVDLGYSSGRYNNLYLSGGVYLGGVVGANLLEDYEEGTHQITVTMSSSGTVTLNTSFDRFSYTKVGRLVTITGNPRIASVSSPVGNLQLTLPFTAVAGQTDECRAGGIMRYYDNSAGAGSYSKPMAWSIGEGASTLLIDNTNTNGNNLTPAASDEFYFSISYMTT